MLTNKITDDQLRDFAEFIQLWRKAIASGEAFCVEFRGGVGWETKQGRGFSLGERYRIVFRPWEAWFNFYPSQCPCEHPTRDEANRHADASRTACRLMREVLDEADSGSDVRHLAEPLTGSPSECCPKTLDKPEPTG